MNMTALKVTIGVLILCISALFSLRFYGLSQHVQAYDHPTMKIPTPWVIAWGGDTEVAPSHSRAALTSASELDSVMLAVNIRMNAEKHFFAIPEGFDVSNQSDDDVKKIALGKGGEPMSLETILQLYSATPILLWIGDNIENIDLRLEPIIRKRGNLGKIIIHSEFDNVVKSLKKLVPQLLYGTGVGQRIRMLMLSSLWLESVATVDGDVLISPLRERGVSSISTGLRDELVRRQKVLILGPLNDVAANDQALTFGATGYLTAMPRYLKNKQTSLSGGVDL
jgi:hypothetical protein